MRYLVDEMPREPIDCPFCEPKLYNHEYACARTGGLCGRFTECPCPFETPFFCDGLVSVPDLITRPKLREELSEARQHCDKCQCDGCPFEAIDCCEDALKIFEMLVTE